ncbi:MAG: hypothetical protein PHV53_08675 [Fermentimonas sp.]|nr:hypothetical protein [Fermentimonas sp.]
MSLLFVSMALFAFTFASCDDDEKAKIDLSFDKSSVELAVGETTTVTVKNGTSPYTATSGDTEKATVTVATNKITVKGVKEGTTTVTVKDKNNNNGKITVKVTAADE